MNHQERFSEWFGNSQTQETQQAQPIYHGFMTNPLAERMTAAQAAMYQAAFEQAQREVQKKKWRVVECMN